jgi:S1-C subfamily serine protease
MSRYFVVCALLVAPLVMASPNDFVEFVNIKSPVSLSNTTKLLMPSQAKSAMGLAAAAKVQAYSNNTSSAVRGAAEASIFQKVAKGTVLIATEEGMGSGAVITDSGFILTNKHVVGDAEKVKVYFYPANSPGDMKQAIETTGTVYKVNDFNDLALVRVSKLPSYVRPIPLKMDGAPSVGEDAHAVGHPRGEPWSYTRGYVSQVRKSYEWKTDEKGVDHKADVVQTQTPINPGNSGGPLVSDKGELIGINSFGNPASPGMNYAVATSTVLDFLKQEGSVRAKKPIQKTSKTNCGKEPVGDERVKLKTGPATKIYFDPNCVGRPTMFLIIPDDETKAIVMTVEHPDHPGKTGVLVADYDRDGEFDYTLVDTDGDGEWDAEGDNRPGEIYASDIRKLNS